MHAVEHHRGSHGACVACFGPYNLDCSESRSGEKHETDFFDVVLDNLPIFAHEPVGCPKKPMKHAESDMCPLNEGQNESHGLDTEDVGAEMLSVGCKESPVVLAVKDLLSLVG